MGANGGPVGQGLESVIFRIDALNQNSYSGAGDTVKSLIRSGDFTIRGVSFISQGGETAFNFTGAGFVTSVSNTGVSGTRSRTMTCWTRFGQKTNQGCMATGANGAGTGMALGTTNTVFVLSFGNSGILTTLTYNRDQWYHLTYVSEFIGGTAHRLYLYVNGALGHTGVASSINLTDSTLRLGMDQSGFALSGYISRANFYDKALSAREIQKSYWNYKSRFGL